MAIISAASVLLALAMLAVHHTVFLSIHAFTLLASGASIIAGYAAFLASRRASGRVRVGWFLVSLGVVIVGAATVLWPAFYLWGAAHGWDPHVILLLYVPTGPLQVIGYVLILSFALSKGAFARRLLDVGIILVALGVFLHDWLLAPALAAQGDANNDLFRLGAEAILLAFLAGNYPRMTPRGRRIFLPLVLGLSLQTVADAAKLHSNLNGGFQGPEALSAGWILGMVGVACTAFLWRPDAVSDYALPTRWRTEIYPVFIGAAAATYLGMGIGHGHWEPHDALSLMSLFALIVLRQSLHVGQLTHARQKLRQAANASAEMAFELESAQNLANLMRWELHVPSRTATLCAIQARMLGLGQTAIQVPVSTLEALGPAETTHAWNVARDACIRTGEPQTVRYRLRDAEGKERHLFARMSLVAGDPDRLYGVSFDVTVLHEAEATRAQSLKREQELEAVKQQNAFKTHLLNAASHELNTPLSALKLQLYILRNSMDSILTGDHRRSLELMERNLARLTRLINDTLDVSRLQSGGLRISKTHIQLGQIVEETLSILRPIAEQGHVRLRYEQEGSADVDADGTRLGQVVFNLVGNAVKYAPAGSEIRVAVRELGDRVECAIQDSGVGLEPEQVKRLFQPFTQVQSEHDQRGGTGLGLFISKGIVDHHGGRMWCESPGRGKGSTFYFEVPKAEGTAKPCVPQAVVSVAATRA